VTLPRLTTSRWISLALTGFDKIWIIDALRPIQKAGEDLPVNACRLDIHEE
jgi:hypothetical protein